MPRDTGRDDGPREWLRRAKGNLARAKQTKPEEAFWEDLCFDAQQAAEKAVKAVLLFRRVPYPYVHDIGELLAVLEQSGQGVDASLKEAAGILSPYAVETRYPGTDEPVTESEYRRAVTLAEQFVRWAEHILASDRR